MTELDQSALHDALFTAIRGEIDDSLSFISGCKQLPRGQRKPRVGSSVRDYLADQIARKVAGQPGESGTETPTPSAPPDGD